MELLEAKKKRAQLEEGIEYLHRESIVWLHTISFWEEENKFFKNLLSNQIFQYVDLKEKSNIDELLKDSLYTKVNAVKNEIVLHEKYLSSVIEKKVEEQDFRHKHKLLAKRFTEVEDQVKIFKKWVLELVKIVNKNFFNSNETIHTIKERRAVRKYLKNPISVLHIEQIISAGRMAPSAMNKQPWKFYVLNMQDRIKKYSEAICEKADNILDLSLKKLHKEEDPIFHGAPVVIFIAAEKDNEWAVIDIGMCAENMMLAAKSLGYDSCPVGLARAIEKTAIYKQLNIPETEKIQLAVVFGYGNEKPKVHKRKTDNVTFLK